MAIRKSIKETLVVDGAREDWFEHSRLALERSGFSKIEVVQPLSQLQAAYRKLTLWGTLQVTLLPEGDDGTRIELDATGNVDNLYAIFRSPSRKILDTFKAELVMD